MKIFVGQIYIEPGVAFPFTLQFQRWLGDILSERVEASELFRNAYGADFSLGLRVSAKKEIDQSEIKGPTVFKRDRSLEFTIFLPHRADINYHVPSHAAGTLHQLLKSAFSVFGQLGLDPTKVLADLTIIETEFMNTSGMIK